jgi:hypothetical protein
MYRPWVVEVSMKIFLAIVFLLGLGFYIFRYHMPIETEITDPHYFETRIKFEQKGHEIEMVAITMMHSYEDCKTNRKIAWTDSFEKVGEVTASTGCRMDLPQKYKKLFDNQRTSASYLAFDKGQASERDIRVLIYGVPASHVYQACQEIISHAKGDYKGDVYCVKGSTG